MAQIRKVRQCEICKDLLVWNDPFIYCDKCIKIVIRNFFDKKNDNLKIKEFREKCEKEIKAKEE